MERRGGVLGEAGCATDGDPAGGVLITAPPGAAPVRSRVRVSAAFSGFD